MKKPLSLFVLVFALTMMPILAVSPGNATDLFEEMSTDEMTYIRGVVSRVSLDLMQIAVRPAKGKRIVISIDPDTLFEGVSQIDELEKKQQVKVWYSVGENINRAIKIKKMMDLGC